MKEGKEEEKMKKIKDVRKIIFFFLTRESIYQARAWGNNLRFC